MIRDRTVWFVVPEGIDDPARVSGGNVYDRHLRAGLPGRGWDLRMAEVVDAAGVDAALAAVDHGDVALVDGLVAAWAPDAVAAAGERTPVVVLAHMVAAAFPSAAPDAVDGERRALLGAGRVIATSAWTAAELVRRGLVDGDRVSVAVPGSRGGFAPLNPAGHRGLLCVGVLAPHKGQTSCWTPSSGSPVGTGAARSPDRPRPIRCSPRASRRRRTASADGCGSPACSTVPSSTRHTGRPACSSRPRGWRASAWRSPTPGGAGSR